MSDAPLTPADPTSDAAAVPVTADDQGEPAPTPHARPDRRLEVQDLVKTYGARRVVDGVSLHVNSGEIVGLLGQNGAGKTTTFYMVVGLVRPNRGEVLLDGRRITRLPMHQRARRGIGYLAQEPSIFRRMTVQENLESILELRPNMTRQQRRERAEQLLHELHIQDRRHQAASTLSGGERRRAEIARALATDPDFILLDEPFTGVDPLHVSEIREIVLQLRETRGIGVLLTDQNPQATLRLCDRAYLLADGRIFLEGTSRALAEHPEARARYFGRDFTF